MILFAADVGGTNTRLCLAEYEGNDKTILYEKDYASGQFNDFYEIVNLFLTDSNFISTIDAACIAAAGPVKHSEASITNLPWVISETSLKNIFKTEYVKLINDFSAVAYGVSELNNDEVDVIQQGKLSGKEFPSAVIVGAGTGLGVSHRVYIDNHYQVLTSEAGHTAFSPQNKLQTQLLHYLQEEKSYVSLEDILSGRGFLVIYNFFKNELSLKESGVVKNLLLQQDPAKVITQAALDETDELCVRTVDLFVSIYGAAVGNAALYYYPVDEVYIAGGIAPKIKCYIQSEAFVSSLTEKGLMSDNMKSLSVKLIKQDKVGLLGALAYARDLLER